MTVCTYFNYTLMASWHEHFISDQDGWFTKPNLTISDMFLK